MMLAKRYCVEYVDGTIECFRDGFWYSEKGVIIKWCILASIFLFFTLWFVGGYLHAKQRMKKGLPLLGYHRWLVSYNERRRYGQTPQNHFTFYAAQQPYGQRQDGAYPEPPPMYNGSDPPPGYFAPPGATKTNPNQAPMEMPQYGMPPPQQPGAYPVGPQQYGVVGGSSSDPEGQYQQQQQQQQQQNSQLPPRPQAAKVALTNFVSRFRR
ncbi:hypothetical protein BS50DRAFT_577185 [Corynespora cassiicola Philippines]|uniref:Uncharacterized protein n=1 Tax=Corynespora cassiicola Philippines TaxID=1448308 RepID=A0A2T2NDB8_CORCC|nr:hypothetical protein BS50DRAFT_577185 [Corynespora cassiicola Philippines]